MNGLKGVHCQTSNKNTIKSVIHHRYSLIQENRRTGEWRPHSDTMFSQRSADDLDVDVRVTNWVFFLVNFPLHLVSFINGFE